MAADDELGPGVVRVLDGLRQLQEEFRAPVADVEHESPAAALTSLEDAVAAAPAAYRRYLEEAVHCYEHGLYRGAVLMVWAAVMQHLYDVIGKRSGGVKAFEAENKKRYGASHSYHEIRRKDDFLYLGDAAFLQLGEDVGMYNRNARKVLIERLDLRNRCGHPTGYTVGREETVIFIESLLLNIVGGAQLNW
jgi:hypothetical protein